MAATRAARAQRASSVVEYTKYTIENYERPVCSPARWIVRARLNLRLARRGRDAFYLWLYPNFMLNAYSGVNGHHLVLPMGVNKCAVIFDYYFAEISPAAAKHHQKASL